jgi:hypothetical protein
LSEADFWFLKTGEETDQEPDSDFEELVTDEEIRSEMVNHHYFCHMTNLACSDWLRYVIFFFNIMAESSHKFQRQKVLFSLPGPKVHVNYCHHLASVVCKLFTFQASSPKPLGRLEPNLAGMLLGWSSTKLLFFVPVGYSIWLPGPIICSDWLKFQRSSSPKLMN